MSENIMASDQHGEEPLKGDTPALFALQIIVMNLIGHIALTKGDLNAANSFIRQLELNCLSNLNPKDAPTEIHKKSYEQISKEIVSMLSALKFAEQK